MQVHIAVVEFQVLYKCSSCYSGQQELDQQIRKAMAFVQKGGAEVKWGAVL